MAERNIGEVEVFGLFADPGLVFSDSKKERRAYGEHSKN
jgi:hypothetical protein